MEFIIMTRRLWTSQNVLFKYMKYVFKYIMVLNDMRFIQFVCHPIANLPTLGNVFTYFFSQHEGPIKCHIWKNSLRIVIMRENTQHQSKKEAKLYAYLLQQKRERERVKGSIFQQSSIKRIIAGHEKKGRMKKKVRRTVLCCIVTYFLFLIIDDCVSFLHI